MPLITVDGLLLKFSKGGVFEGIILEKRSRSVDREAGKWAFPAGFVNAHETMSEALAYEVFEEIGISLKENQFLPIYKIGTGPYRDSRWLVWTQFLVAFTTEDLPKTKTDYIASQEVEIAKAFPPDRLPPENQIAFDHAKVLTDFSSSIPDYVKYAKEKIERNKLSLKN
jgi:ADP-ribose pyrophosphatase YjhB (NUDIX family)